MASDPVNVSEFEELARHALPKMNYDYFRGGAEDQTTLKENICAFQRIMLRPRVLVDVSKIDMSTTLLGYKMPAPIIIAPTGHQQLAHPNGEVATARAAATCNTIMVLSFSSCCKIEDVASSCNAVRFYQLYVYKRRDVAVKLVQKAENCGFKALVLTVDTPRLGRREADIKNKMIAPKLSNLEGLLSVEFDSKGASNLEAFASATLDPSLSWKFIDSTGLYRITNKAGLLHSLLRVLTRPSLFNYALITFLAPMLECRGHGLYGVTNKDLEWLKSITKLPILIKGILTAEDARKAVDAGVSGIIVSNHGARQLDYTPATISVLEEVVTAVSGAVPVLLDGGVRRGTDVYKALALGAKAVMIGRPVVYGLAAKGESGVKTVIEMLQNELELTMALTGCPSIKDITRNHVRTKRDLSLRSMI